MTRTSRLDYGWVVVAAGALMTCIGFGTMLSLAVFLQPISKAMGWSTAGVSAAATLDFLFMGFAANYVAKLIQRFHWINYIGLAVILYVAGTMIYEGWVGGEHVLGLRQVLGVA